MYITAVCPINKFIRRINVQFITVIGLLGLFLAGISADASEISDTSKGVYRMSTAAEYNGKIYFYDEGSICTMNLDGSEKTVWLDAENDYRFMVTEQYVYILYYQHYDNDFIKIYDFSGNELGGFPSKAVTEFRRLLSL